MTDQPHPNLHRTWRPGLVLALPLTLLTLTACDADEVETLDEVGELDVTLEPSSGPRELGPTPSIEAPPGFVLALTGAPTDAPVLRALADELDMLDATELDVHELADAVADSEAIAIDLALVRPEQLDAWSPVFEAAREARVPILFDRAHDAGAMARVLGFGVEADAVLAESLAPTMGYRLRTFGGSVERESSEDSIGQAPHDVTTEPLGPKPDLIDAGPDELDTAAPERIAEGILEHLDVIAANGDVVPYSGSLPPGSHAHYEILTDHTWDPWDGTPFLTQDATMEIDFAFDLYAAANDEKKYLVITPMGGGVSPGTLAFDDDDYRGFFQEQLEVIVRPEHEDLDDYKHAPLTTNASSTFTTSTSMSVDATVSNPPAVNVGFSQGTSATVTLSDFGVTDQSIGLESRWQFRMTAAGDGTAYDESTDLVKDTISGAEIRSLPALAKSTLVPEFETVYSTDEYFENIVRQHIQYKHKLRRFSIDDHWLYYDWYTSATTEILAYAIAIDFAKVAQPHDGTLRFDESWSGSPIPDRWDPPVQEGSNGTTQWTFSANNWVRQTGNAYGNDSNGVPRGAYLEAHASYFSQGSLSVPVRPDDNDTWGVMYSIQDAQNYYRAEIDKERNFARIVKLAGSQYTVLATVPLVGPGDPAFALGQWHDLRILRQGVAHHLYLDGEHLLTAYDATFGTGATALYSWGMSSVYFGKVRVRRPYEPNRNLAYGRPTLQSSTSGPYVSSKAVDGSTVGDASMCEIGTGSYWQVDLQSTRTIDEVVIWAAISSDFRIEVLDQAMNVVASAVQGANQPAKGTYNMGGVQGRYVRITKQGFPSILGFREVEVYGPTD